MQTYTGVQQVAFKAIESKASHHIKVSQFKTRANAYTSVQHLSSGFSSLSLEEKASGTG